MKDTWWHKLSGIGITMATVGDPAIWSRFMISRFMLCVVVPESLSFWETMHYKVGLDCHGWRFTDWIFLKCSYFYSSTTCPVIPLQLILHLLRPTEATHRFLPVAHQQEVIHSHPLVAHHLAIQTLTRCTQTSLIQVSGTLRIWYSTGCLPKHAHLPALSRPPLNWNTCTV